MSTSIALLCLLAIVFVLSEARPQSRYGRKANRDEDDYGRYRDEDDDDNVRYGSGHRYSHGFYQEAEGYRKYVKESRYNDYEDSEYYLRKVYGEREDDDDEKDDENYQQEDEEEDDDRSYQTKSTYSKVVVDDTTTYTNTDGNVNVNANANANPNPNPTIVIDTSNIDAVIADILGGTSDILPTTTVTTATNIPVPTSPYATDAPQNDVTVPAVPDANTAATPETSTTIAPAEGDDTPYEVTVQEVEGENQVYDSDANVNIIAPANIGVVTLPDDGESSKLVVVVLVPTDASGEMPSVETLAKVLQLTLAGDDGKVQAQELEPAPVNSNPAALAIAVPTVTIPSDPIAIQQGENIITSAVPTTPVTLGTQLEVPVEKAVDPTTPTTIAVKKETGLSGKIQNLRQQIRALRREHRRDPSHHWDWKKEPALNALRQEIRDEIQESKNTAQFEKAKMPTPKGRFPQ